jgi:acyl carrier protein
LAYIWQALLGVEMISVFGNFFDLGGHSLLAVSLFAKIEKQIGQNLPIALLFQHPTIAQLANIILKQEPTQNWSALVPIQPEGTRPPFFCVHGGAGHVFNYFKLAGHLDEDQPFYGVQPPDWTMHRVDVPDVIELAKRYLAEIRRFQPNGPYYLGGFCFGGTIVFEIAQQLQAAGEEVALLALIEPAAAIGRGALLNRAQSKNGETVSPWFTHLSYKGTTSTWSKIKRAGFGILFHARRLLLHSVRQLKRSTFALYLMSGAPVPPHLRDFYLIQFVTRLSRKAYKPANSFEGDIHLTVIDRGRFVDHPGLVPIHDGRVYPMPGKNKSRWRLKRTTRSGCSAGITAPAG